jgi:hypothetical protein
VSCACGSKGFIVGVRHDDLAQDANLGPVDMPIYSAVIMPMDLPRLPVRIDVLTYGGT